MSGMNWEHRNKMQKVWHADRLAAQKVGRNKKRKKPQKGKKLDSYQGFVLLKSKWDTTCAQCQRPVRAGANVWWYPEGKCVLHDYCFEGLVNE